MLFNSYAYVFAFLPLVAAGFFLLARTSHRLAAGWLALSSLFFYGWWDANYVMLLLASIAFNYACATRIARLADARRSPSARRWLIAAITVDLALLGCFKYTLFFLRNLQGLTGHAMPSPDIVLPLGISFFTFTQIAFLVDTYRGQAREYNFVHYTLFVSYFPHLIAGPILHHKEMMPQFGRASTYRFNWENVAVGLTMFIIGLAKKALVADEMAGFATPAFDAAAAGAPLTLLEAWGAALCYSFQLYFDFSGYTDMAMGAARIFGITFPRNFDSPYKAANIIDFWRRWNLTLSRFLRDYVYIPLGGNRHGGSRRYANLLVTMLIGGLWHGAGWTFVLWGALHGVYLVVNHGWQAIRRRFSARSTNGGRAVAILVTFITVVVAWVVFRAPDIETAARMLRAMTGADGVVLPPEWRNGVTALLANRGVEFAKLAHFERIRELNWLLFALVFCWAAPNTQEILARYRPALVTPGYPPLVSARLLTWRPNLAWLAAEVVLAVAALLSLYRYSEFIYFQF